MDDLFTAHAERVRRSNEAHQVALKQLREEVDVAVRKEIAAFGARMIAFETSMNIARQDLVDMMEEIFSASATRSDEAFAANQDEIAASGAEMDSELHKRAVFMATGELPAEQKLLESEGAVSESAPTPDDQSEAA